MGNSIVKVDHLSHRYTVQWAVKDISFEIPQRGIYGLLGSNGAGKSTMMNIICGVIKPTEGTVFIDGINAGEDPIAAKERIGFLPQKPPLYDDLTVEEYGYQQRVGIAQAIIHKPEIVIFDEPTNGLDPTQIVEIRQLIKNIAQDRTVILSTHILSEVQAICDHILLVEQGQLVFNGKMEEFNNYIVPSSMIVTLADAPATEELEAIPGVCGVEELGGRQFRIHFDDAEEVAERLVDLSTARHWQLTEMRQEKTSLDTIFAVLSKKVQK